MISVEIIRKNLKINPLAYTRNILIETTNRCNYAVYHTRCPLHYIKEKNILSLKIIQKVLTELGMYKFSGIIYPFNYSEPLIDPRFFKIVEMIKALLPAAKIRIYTNGFMVDDTMLEELEILGLDRISFSVYTPEEGKYIRKMILRNRDKMKTELRAYQRWPMNTMMNDKVDWYTNKPLNLTLSCPSPLRFLTINALGQLQICCHDWQKKHVFGDLHNETLAEIVNKKVVAETYYNLINGQRYKYVLCSRCWKRR